jgi:hypothetical protein
MGVGQAVFGVLTIIAVGVPAAAGMLRLRRWWKSRQRDLSDTLAERVQQTVSRHQVNSAPVIGVPALDQLDLLAPWDVLPVDDEWRLIARLYLERMWALPAAERAS